MAKTVETAPNKKNFLIINLQNSSPISGTGDWYHKNGISQGCSDSKNLF